VFTRKAQGAKGLSGEAILARVAAIVEDAGSHVEPEEYASRYREKVRREVKAVLENGVSSWDDLIALACDAVAATPLRITACELLQKLGDKRAAPALLGLVAETDLEVRHAAIGALGGLKSKRGVLPLIEILLRHAKLETRLTAAWALGLVNDERACAPLLQVFRDLEEDEMLRIHAAIALGNGVCVCIVPDLVNVLQSDETPAIRGYAAHALGFIGDRSAYEPLVRALADPNEVLEVRCEAAEALGELCEKRAIPVFRALLRDPHPEIRFWCLYGLMNTAAPDVIPELIYIAETDEAVIPGWRSIRKEALDAVEHILHRACWPVDSE
jgi:HEAT repeat protein